MILNKRGASLALAGAVVIAALAFWLWPRPLVWACGARSGEDLLPNGNGSTYTDGPITIDMNDLPPDDPRMPRGGRYIYPGDASNLKGDDAVVSRVTLYDAACDSIVIDGQPLTRQTLPESFTVVDADGGEGVSMVLNFGSDRAVVLRGIPMAYWAAGAAQQKHGTAGPDAMAGDSSDEVFVPGGGPDTVAPAGGNDRVVYSFGDLTIQSTPPNAGQDTLNLSRYKLGDIGLAVDGDDLLLTTTEGTIRIQDQLSSPESNIETLLLADKNMLDMTGMPALLAERAAN